MNGLGPAKICKDSHHQRVDYYEYAAAPCLAAIANRSVSPCAQDEAQKLVKYLTVYATGETSKTRGRRLTTTCSFMKLLPIYYYPIIQVL